MKIGKFQPSVAYKRVAYKIKSVCSPISVNERTTTPIDVFDPSISSRTVRKKKEANVEKMNPTTKQVIRIITVLPFVKMLITALVLVGGVASFCGGNVEPPSLVKSGGKFFA